MHVFPKLGLQFSQVLRGISVERRKKQWLRIGANYKPVSECREYQVEKSFRCQSQSIFR